MLCSVLYMDDALCIFMYEAALIPVLVLKLGKVSQLPDHEKQGGSHGMLEDRAVGDVQLVFCLQPILMS